MNEKPVSAAPAEADPKRALFEKQKELLDTFLRTGAITRAQYETSLTGLREKMGMDKK